MRAVIVLGLIAVGADPASCQTGASDALAQSAQKPAEAIPAKLAVDLDKFREGYRETTNVSSSVLAGLALGSARGSEPISNIIIAAAGLRDAGSFCLHVLSRDGQFWAENPFLAPREGDYWSVQNISVKYKEELLKKYKIDDVFVAAGLVPHTTPSGGTMPAAGGAKACEQRDVVYAPTIAFENDRAGPLRAYVNSEGRYTEAELWRGDKRAYVGKCRRPEAGGNVVFDQVCAFEFATIPPGGIYALKLIFGVPPFGVDEWSQKIALPSGTDRAK